MLNQHSFSDCPEDDTVIQGIPSYESFCDGLTPKKSSRIPLKETSRSEHRHWLLAETVLEADYKFSAEFEPYFPPPLFKRPQFQSKLNLENLEENPYFPKKIHKENNDKQPNMLSSEPFPSNTRSFSSFKSSSTAADHNLNQLRFNNNCADDKQIIQSIVKQNLVSFSCFDDKEKSKKPVIPILKDKNEPNIDYITPATLVNIMNNPKLELSLVDCRYEYEYRGGHIKNATNINTPELMQERFFNAGAIQAMQDLNKSVGNLKSLEEEDHQAKEVIVVLYCEFSQKRAPQILKALRNVDRNLNADQWPALYYPHVYLLEGGYKNFHSQFPEICDPVGGYVEMLDLKYKKEYYKAKESEKRAWNPRVSFETDKVDSFSLKASKRKEF